MKEKLSETRSFAKFAGLYASEVCADCMRGKWSPMARWLKLCVCVCEIDLEQKWEPESNMIRKQIE